jgi:hypothetical protein
MLLIASCGSKEEEVKPANFIVNEVQMLDLKTTKSHKSEGLTEIKDMAHYYLKVCLKDPAVGKAIIDSPFVANLNGKSKNITTDFDGCFSWYGDIDFSMLKCESYKEHNLTLTGAGNYTGAITIPLYFNPTNKAAKAFMDGRYSQPQALSANNCEDSKFKVKNIELNRVKNNDSLQFTLNMTPMIERNLIDGDIENIVLKTNGEFEIQARIITELNSETVEVTKTQTTGHINSQKLKANLDFDMPKIDLPSNDLKYQMEIKVKSLTDKRLKTYTGVINSNDIFFKQKEKIEEVEQTIETQELTQVVDVKSLETTSATHIKAKEIQVNLVEDIGDEYSQEKTKKIALSTCFYNKLSQFGSEPIANKDFKVATKSGLKIKVEQTTNSTNESGCLKYNLYVDYKLFGKRNWNETELVFTSGETNITKKIQVNPWTKSSPVRDVEFSKVTTQLIDENESFIFVEKVKYGQIGNVDGSFYVNKFADLFYKKKYFIEFKPFVKLSRSFSENGKLKDLNFGKLKVRLSLFAYHKDIKDIKKVDFSNLTLLSATEKEAKVDLSGRYYIEPTMPFEVSDALHLSVKSLLVMEVIPTEGLDGLNKQKFVLDFFGTNSATTKDAFVSTNEFNDEQNELITQMLEQGHAFTKGLHTKVAKNTNSISLFRDNLDNDSRNISYDKITTKEFFALKEVKEAKLGIKSARVLMQAENRIPKKQQEALCNMMYSGTLDYFKRGDCKEDFYQYVQVKGANHIVDTVSFDEFSRENEVSKASVVPGSEENDGSLNRGYAFMAAKGYRASEAWGSSDSLTESISASLYYDGPPSVFLMTAGVTKSHTAFTENVNAKMHMMFTRTFSTLTPVKLNYNSITVNFPAQVQRCFIITDIKKNKYNFHVCEDQARRSNITEKWYFIGESDANRHGVLTDGVEVGEKANLKVIRGEKNFKQIWQMFEKEDTKTVIAEMEDFKLGEKFLEYKSDNKVNIDMETAKSSSFPGLLR